MRRLRAPFVAGCALGLLGVLLGCNGGSQQDPLVARGRSVYMANCIACHNPNPHKDGNVGPALQGSSEELLRARVLEIRYPPGYTPKRPTKVMPPLPHLKPEIEALHAFLNH
jgi:mono/diheme cytochrome c family protein